MDTLIIFVGKYLIFIAPIFLLYYIWTRDERTKAIKESLLIGIGSVVGWGVSNIIKNILKIPRPELASDVLFKNESLYSFPSGHTTFFFTLGTVMYFYHKKTAIIIFILGAMVGCARVLMGVHFPVDIFGGATLGIIVGLAIQIIKAKFLTKYF
ncbi:MAG: hypothetical protein QG614_303 [Patescibacteria group bacterium]|nr:hypothetical protein [Patescibacteria group bacterium]